MKPLVILDFDGVIRNSKRASYLGSRAALKAVGLKAVYSADDYWRLRGFKEFNERRKALAAIYSVAASGKKLKDVLRNAPESVIALEKEFPAPAALADAMEEANKKVVAVKILEAPFVVGARNGLKKLGKIARLAVVSDSRRRGVRKWMRKHGLNGFFSVVLCREDVPELKPSPKGIKKVLKKTSVGRENIFYVGDAESDIVAARAAGVNAIGVGHGMASEEMLWRAGAGDVFSDLSEFADWLRKRLT